MENEENESRKKYKAFVSYSHANNQGEGRKWADWLHHALETYEIPEDLIGKKNQSGQEIPRQIFPVFQDEKELSASSSLNTALSNALDNAEFLIYLSSPRSAQSQYVRNEIRHFKQSGKSKQIIALILSGEPEYGDRKTDAQCFPDELRYNVDENGDILYDQPEEVLAADVRIPNTEKEGFTSPEAYRRYLHNQKVTGAKLKSAVDEYKKRLDLALLKIIAGILDIPLSELTKRDQAYQLEKAKQRNKNIKRIAIAISALAIIAIIAGFFAWNQRNSALRNLARSLYASGINKLTESEYGDGAAYIAEATRQGDENAEMFGHSMLAVQADLALMPNISGNSIRFSPDGKWIAGFANAGGSTYVMQIWNANERKLYKQLDQVKTNQVRPPLFDVQNRLYTSDANGDIMRYDISHDKMDIVRKNLDSILLILKAVSPDGKNVAYTKDMKTFLFNTETQQEHLLYETPSFVSSDIFFDKASTTLVLNTHAMGPNNTTDIAIFDISTFTPKEIKKIQFPSSIKEPSFSNDGKQIVFTSLEGLHYYNIATGTSWNTPAGLDKYNFAGFTEKGVLNAGNAYKSDVIDINSGRILKSKSLLPDLFFASNSITKSVMGDPSVDESTSPDWTQQIVSSNSQSFIENIKGDALRIYQHYADRNLKAVIPGIVEDEIFMLNKKSKSISKMNVQTGALKNNFVSIGEEIAFMDVLQKSKVLLLKGESGKTYFFDPTNGKPIGTPFDSQVKGYIFNSDQTQVLARTAADQFGIWEIHSGKKIVDFKYMSPIDKFVANPDFKSFLMVDDQSWKIVDIATKKIIKEEKTTISSAKYSTNGAYLVVVEASGKAQVLNTKNYKPVIAITTIEFPFIVFNNAGNVVAISEDSNHMRLWNLETKKSFGQTIRVSKSSKYFHFSEDDSKIFVQDDTEKLTFAAKIIDAQSGNILTMPFINQRFESIYVMPGDKQLLTVEALVNGAGLNIWELPGQIAVSKEQLANDLEKFYGKKYDTGTGAILAFTGSDSKFSTWYFEDPFTRTVSPSSTTRITDEINRNYPIKSDANLQSLALSYGYHPLARAMVTNYFCSSPETQYIGVRLLDITEKQLIKIKNKELKASVEKLLKEAKANLNH